MKRIYKIAFAVLLAGISLASAIPAHAIGFDAETVYKSVFVIYSGDSLGSGFCDGGELHHHQRSCGKQPR